MKRIVVIPDLQIPYHDSRAVNGLTEFVKDYQPDELFCVGDEADSPEPSRWTKGTAGEYAGTLQKGLDATASIMKRFKEASGDKPFHVMRSNHGDRIQHYVNRYAPALASLRELEYTKLLGYDENEITYHNSIWSFSPGWVLAHGDEGNLIKSPGGTALSLARKVGSSVVCGHTHKLGIQHEHSGFNGKIQNRLYGIEVGHLMDLGKAGYLKSGGANWQQGFAILYIDSNKKVTFNTIPINGRSFIAEGKKYAW